jgi:hypothetical protein
MDENPGLSEQYRMASPWPLFVALGIPIAEVGILFDFFPVAVGGILLFGGSVSGMVREAGYAQTPWRALGVVALLFLVFGAGLAFSELQLISRGYAVITAAALMFAGGLVGEFVITDPHRQV